MNLVCSYEKWASRLGGISRDFAGIPTRWDENLSYERVQVGQPGKVG